MPPLKDKNAPGASPSGCTTAIKNYYISLATLLQSVSLTAAVAENQPANKHRMNQELSTFATLLGGLMAHRPATGRPQPFSEPPRSDTFIDKFNHLALELFGLQFKHNLAYQKICTARGLTPQGVEQWTQIPAVPTAAFKALELTSLPPEARTAVFHSSGTTEQTPSRHFHSAESLAVYEASLWSWFAQNISANSPFSILSFQWVCLTPPPALVPHSSLVHMLKILQRNLSGPGSPASQSGFFGKLSEDGAWILDFAATLAALNHRSPRNTQNPQLVLGTAFSFVHLLDYLTEHDLRIQLPTGSRVMETGGYKNRSRSLPKAELHALITERLGVRRENIICEYGMSELSSQAYDNEALGFGCGILSGSTWRPAPNAPRRFHFPPWSRVQIISPETGREVAEGETGLIRILDLANVFSVAAIQTEDLGIRRGDGFELLGRDQMAEPRGCSLMAA